MTQNHHQASGKKLAITVFLNLLISIGQLFGGFLSGSISLLTDALHNFSDVLSLLLSWFTNRLAKNPSNERFTFGYKRAEIIAAFVNSLTLVFIAVFLLIEAIKQFWKPHSIFSDWVIFFACASIVINVLSVLLLHQDAKHSLNIKSAYLHLLTDVMTSVVVLIGGILMKYYEIYWVDGLLSILIAVYLIITSFKILKHSALILMQATPNDINLHVIKNEILSFEQVYSVEKIRAWQLNEKEYFMELLIKADSSNELINRIKKNIQNYTTNKIHINIEVVV